MSIYNRDIILMIAICIRYIIRSDICAANALNSFKFEVLILSYLIITEIVSRFEVRTDKPVSVMKQKLNAKTKICNNLSLNQICNLCWCNRLVTCSQYDKVLSVKLKYVALTNRLNTQLIVRAYQLTSNEFS